MKIFYLNLSKFHKRLVRIEIVVDSLEVILQAVGYVLSCDVGDISRYEKQYGLFVKDASEPIMKMGYKCGLSLLYSDFGNSEYFCYLSIFQAGIKAQFKYLAELLRQRLYCIEEHLMYLMLYQGV